jgi:hypothetical protein
MRWLHSKAHLTVARSCSTARATHAATAGSSPRRAAGRCSRYRARRWQSSGRSRFSPLATGTVHLPPGSRGGAGGDPGRLRTGSPECLVAASSSTRTSYRLLRRRRRRYDKCGAGGRSLRTDRRHWRTTIGGSQVVPGGREHRPRNDLAAATSLLSCDLTTMHVASNISGQRQGPVRGQSPIARPRPYLGSPPHRVPAGSRGTGTCRRKETGHLAGPCL